MRDLTGRTIVRTDTTVTVEWSEDGGWRYVTHVTLYLDDLSTVEYGQPAFPNEAPECPDDGDTGYATDIDGMFQCSSCGVPMHQEKPAAPYGVVDRVPDHVQPAALADASLF